MVFHPKNMNSYREHIMSVAVCARMCVHVCVCVCVVFFLCQENALVVSI